MNGRKLYRKRIGNIILDIRRKLDLTQTELADLYNLKDDGMFTNQRNISKYEKGVVACPAEVLMKILSFSEEWA